MKKIILLIALLPLFLHAIAQNRTITGKVTDDKGNPLAGVTISSGQSGTTTNPLGEFSLTVGSSVKRLSFSYVGYTTISRELGNESNV